LEDVGAFVTDEEISAEPARQRVVSDAADHAVVAKLSEQKIVAGIALQVVISRIDVVAIATHDVVIRLTFPALPSSAALRERIRESIPDAQYFDDLHGAPAWRKHMTLQFAEEIRRELSPGPAP
jgi:hypothetical protein